MLLSDEELWALVPNADNLNDARKIESAILAKLASAELPEPVGAYESIGSTAFVEGFPVQMLDICDAYSADQLRQAYAQGAAAQLAEKPNAWKDWCGQYFGPDSDDSYLAKAVFELPPIAQKFRYAQPKALEPLTAKEDWDIRGILASKLRVFHRATEAEVDELISLFAYMKSRTPLTQPEVVEAFCNTRHNTQYVSVFDAGVRFAEKHHGITKGTP